MVNNRYCKQKVNNSAIQSNPIWGGMLEVYGYGYNSSGGTWSSGPVYGRVWTHCDPEADFYYAIFHMAMERDGGY